MVLTIAALFALVGVLMFALSTNPKLSEIGRIMFFCGLLVLLLNVGGVVNLLPAR